MAGRDVTVAFEGVEARRVDVEVQLTQQFPIQRAFTNRSIERLFAGWSGHKQFLAKDSVSEVIITR